MEKIYRVQLNSKGMPNFATAEEIVECAECKFCGIDDGTPYFNTYCKLHKIRVFATDFCSYGKREGE